MIRIVPRTIKVLHEGGAGSGDFGHAGVPGKVGGSAHAGQKATERADQMKQIGVLHDQAQHTPNDPATKAAYEAFKTETLKQYEDLKARGVGFEFTKTDPYVDSKTMRADIANNNHLAVYTVADDLPADHPLAAPAEDGQSYNTIFRGVHDYNGHYVGNHTFGPNGELGAYQTHAKMYSNEALPALAAETLAQNAWVNYGPHNPENLSYKDRPFARQKAYAFPLDLAQDMREAATPEDDGIDERHHHQSDELLEGGPGSGDRGHAGRKGIVGGSSPAMEFKGERAGEILKIEGKPEGGPYLQPFVRGIELHYTPTPSDVAVYEDEIKRNMGLPEQVKKIGVVAFGQAALITDLEPKMTKPFRGWAGLTINREQDEGRLPAMAFNSVEISLVQHFGVSSTVAERLATSTEELERLVVDHEMGHVLANSLPKEQLNSFFTRFALEAKQNNAGWSRYGEMAPSEAFAEAYVSYTHRDTKLPERYSDFFDEMKLHRLVESNADSDIRAHICGFGVAPSYTIYKDGRIEKHPALTVMREGGAGSGDRGHVGRPGERGGSGPAAPRKSTLVRHILEQYKAATDQEKQYGLHWYEATHTFAAGLVKKYGITLQQAAGIIAALSPQTEWARNMTMAEEMAKTGKTGGLSRSISQAQAIMAGGNPDEVMHGSKTLSFYHNIMDPTGDNHVTIDRHAIALAVGHVAYNPKWIDNKGHYQAFADAYRAAAEQVGLRPHEVQGITWAHWRDTALRRTPMKDRLYEARRILRVVSESDSFVRRAELREAEKVTAKIDDDLKNIVRIARRRYVFAMNVVIKRYQRALVLACKNASSELAAAPHEGLREHLVVGQLISKLIDIGKHNLALAANMGTERALEDLQAYKWLRGGYEQPVIAPARYYAQIVNENAEYLNSSLRPDLEAAIVETDASPFTVLLGFQYRISMYAHYAWRAAETAYRATIKDAMAHAQ